VLTEKTHLQDTLSLTDKEARHALATVLKDGRHA